MQDSVSQDRHKYIGGSDIPIIMGISPFKSRFELLQEKALIKESDFTGNTYTEYGNTMEPKIREHINISYDLAVEEPFVEGKHVKEAEGDEIIGVRIHTDGENSSAILEIKTTSQIHENLEDYKLYLVQLLYYMHLTKRERGVLAVYERPEDLSEEFDEERLHIYEVDIGSWQNLVKDIEREIARFIEDLKKVKENPEITEEDLIPAEVITVANQILVFEKQLEAMKELEKKIKADKAKLKKAMVEFNVKTWKTPSGFTITLVPDGASSTVKVFDEERFQKENKELYKEYLKETTKAGRAGYVKITAPSEKSKEAKDE